MSETKDILILASSFKDGGRCVAGKTVDGKQWIRPVSKSGGSLSDSFFREAQAQPDNIVGGVYGVPLVAHCPHKHQRENWTAASGEGWTFRQPVGYGDLANFEDKVQTLWANTGGDNNKVAHDDAKAWGNSLLLIKVRGAKVYWVKKPRRRKASYAHFLYGGYEYSLRATGAEVKDMGIPRKLPECFMCISLCNPLSKGPEEGMCYKLVASVITPEHFK